MDCDGLIGASGQAGSLTQAVVAVRDGVATVPAEQLTTDRIAALMGDAAYDRGWLRLIERRAIQT